MDILDDKPPRTLVVVGHGQAGAVPDRCTISAVLRVTSAGVADAISSVASLADAVWTALREFGIADSALSTHNVHVQDVMDHVQQQVTARVAMYIFTAEVADLHEVSSVVTLLAATAGDALQIQTIGFSHSDRSALTAIARRAAVADAGVRAQQLAEAAGVQVGEILAIEEESAVGGGWVGRAVAGGARGTPGPAMPVNPGTHTVSARVVVTYALS